MSILYLCLFQLSRNRVSTISNCPVWVQSTFSLLYEREVLMNTEMSLKVRQQKRGKNQDQENSHQDFLLPEKLRADIQYERPALKKKRFVFFFLHIFVSLLKTGRWGLSSLSLIWRHKWTEGQESPWPSLCGWTVIPLFGRDLVLWNLYIEEDKAKIQVVSCKFKVFCVFC